MKKQKMSKAGFILSAIGAAVGLGNVWGFPTKMMQYGGAAFLIPYIIAIITLGLPLLILEISMGSKWRKTPILFFKKYLGRFGNSFAWMQSAGQLLIGTYYVIIIAWVLASAFPAFTGFNHDSKYFDNYIMGATSSHASTVAGLGKIQPVILILFLAIIAIVGFIIYKGVKGIEKANKVMVPFLFITIIFLCIYSMNLKGSYKGLNLMFTPDISKLANGTAWSAAFAQALFSVGVCLSIVIIYSSYSTKGGDSTNRAVTIVSGDSLIALLSCVIMGAAIGYASHKGIVEIDGGIVKDISASGGETELKGSSFIFKMFPEIFKNINGEVAHLGSIIGFLFYVALVFAAISSLIGIFEPAIETWKQGHNWTRKKAVITTLLITFCFGIIYMFQNGSQILDITDSILVRYIIILCAIIEIGMLVFAYNKYKELIDFTNKNSIYKLRKWFYYLVCFSLLLMIVIAGYGIYSDIVDTNWKNFTAIEWFLSLASYMLPWLFIVIFYGSSSFWQKIHKKICRWLATKRKKVKND